MRNPVTIPLTKDKTRNLITGFDNILSIADNDPENDFKPGFEEMNDPTGSTILFLTNGAVSAINSELSATDLYEEICSPSK